MVGGPAGRRLSGRVPADVRPARAGDPRRGARSAAAGRGRRHADARAPGRRGPRRAHRRRSRRALAPARRGGGREALHRRARGRGSASPGGRRRRRAGGAARGGRRGGRREARRLRPPLAVRQPAVGPALRRARARLPAPDRGLQAGAGAAVRLLRPAARGRRPGRRPCRRQGRSQGRRASPARLAPRVAPPVGGPRRGAGTGVRALGAANCGSSQPARLAGGGVRDPRHPRRPGPGPAHRRGDRADLRDVDLRPDGLSASLATTTRAPPIPLARPSRRASRRSRAPRTGSRSGRAWRPRRPSCTCSSRAPTLWQ